MATPYAFVTLLTSDSYLQGALTLAAALRDVHPSPAVSPEVEFETVCLVTPETVDVSTIKLLRRAFDVVVGVEIISQKDTKNLTLLGRPDLDTVLTKLHVFRLTQYSKIVFLDADVLPIRPLSHLFTIPHDFSAVPDVGWPDIFNSGVLVLSPGQEKFDELNALLESKGSWDGGDQGLLNEWRGSNWNRLSFTYNTTPTAAYTYAPAYERYGSQISAIHFIGPDKPWHSAPYRAPFQQTALTEAPEHPTYDYNSLLDRWFAVYDTHYRSQDILPQAGFEVKHYTSVWEDRPSGGQPPGAPPPGNAIGLEDLRKVAIEGSSSFFPSKRSGDGEYRSMPLGGRVDLMRRHISESAEEEVGEEDVGPVSTPTPQLLTALSDSPLLPGTTQLLMTPVIPPPSPHLGTVSLPQTPFLTRSESLPTFLVRQPSPQGPAQHQQPFQYSPQPSPLLQPVQHTQPHALPASQTVYQQASHGLALTPQYVEPALPADQQYASPSSLSTYPQATHQYIPMPQPLQSQPQSKLQSQPQSKLQSQPQSQPQSKLYSQPQFHQSKPQSQPQSQFHSQPQSQPQSRAPQSQAPFQQHALPFTQQAIHEIASTQSIQYTQPAHQRPDVPLAQPTYHEASHEPATFHSVQSTQPSYQQATHESVASFQLGPSQPPPSPPRPASPPKVKWNPAIEPPPNTPPPVSAFPSDTYFPNVWDKTPSKLHDQTFQPRSSGVPPEPAGVFFRPPPTPEIPRDLLKQGHYRNVTGDEMGVSPSPDRSKVKSVFPWEEKPRQMPGRIFPEYDAPPPELFSSPELTPNPPLVPSAPSQPVSPPQPALPRGLPRSLAFTNAWDNVPSIQKYAERLVRPAMPMSALAPAFDVEEWNKTRGGRSWEERSEANSRDGDDEDDGEDDTNNSEHRRWTEVGDREEEQSPGGTVRVRSRRDSNSVSASYAIKGKKKEYRVRGVQTIPREMRSQGVQVNMNIDSQKVPSHNSQDQGRTLSRGNVAKAWASTISPPSTGVSPGPELPMTTASPTPVRANSLEGLPTSTPTGMRSPRELSFPPAVGPLASSTPQQRQRVSPPSSVSRQTSNDTSLTSPPSSVGPLTSPPSSIGPLSPPEGQQILSPGTRKGGRVWDPARGVELFKRGSEEVLARFLKMGSWEDER